MPLQKQFQVGTKLIQGCCTAGSCNLACQVVVFGVFGNVSLMDLSKQANAKLTVHSEADVEDAVNHFAWIPQEMLLALFKKDATVELRSVVHSSRTSWHD